MINFYPFRFLPLFLPFFLFSFLSLPSFSLSLRESLIFILSLSLILPQSKKERDHSLDYTDQPLILVTFLPFNFFSFVLPPFFSSSSSSPSMSLSFDSTTLFHFVPLPFNSQSSNSLLPILLSWIVRE